MATKKKAASRTSGKSSKAGSAKVRASKVSGAGATLPSQEPWEIWPQQPAAYQQKYANAVKTANNSWGWQYGPQAGNPNALAAAKGRKAKAGAKKAAAKRSPAKKTAAKKTAAKKPAPRKPPARKSSKKK